MKKEPLGLYLFRFLLAFGLFAFMGMLYWSNSLIESDIKKIERNLKQIKKEISSLRFHAKENMYRKPSAIKKEIHAHIDLSQKNLLQEDPFYLKTLPGLLPKDFQPHGIFQQASIGKPHNLHPFSNWSHINSWISLCNVRLAKLKFGIYETMAPDMAIRLEERTNPETGLPEFWVFLRDGVFWEPLEQKYFPNLELAPHFLKRHQVTAEDFKLFFDALMNPFVQNPGAISLRNYFSSISEIEVIDTLTFIVRWKGETTKNKEGEEVKKIKYIARQWTGFLQPLASFVYKYFPDGEKILDEDSAPNTYRTNSVWAQNFSEHWAKNCIPSCGAWLFDGMTEREIRFKRNPQFYEPLAALGEKIVVSFKSTPDAIWQSFKANKLDTYNIQPDQLIELDDFLDSKQYVQQADKESSINQIHYLGRTYSYIGWNQSTPFFKSRKVRQAMTMAIDRQRIIDQNLNGLGIEITGTFSPHSKATDPSIKPWPFDPDLAKQLLEEEGWFDSDGDGVLDKVLDGKTVPFTFSLTYYVKNPLSKSICEYIATALKQIGIICNLHGVDIADLSATFEEKSFDAIFLGWALGQPPEDPKQLWHSTGAKQQGSSNGIGFMNEEVDAIIEQLQYEYNPEKRIALYHRFDAIIHKEQPYTFLFAPKSVMLYRNWVKNIFIPADRQDLIPGANVAEPVSSVFWLQKGH